MGNPVLAQEDGPEPLKRTRMAPGDIVEGLLGRRERLVGLNCPFVERLGTGQVSADPAEVSEVQIAGSDGPRDSGLAGVVAFERQYGVAVPAEPVRSRWESFC